MTTDLLTCTKCNLCQTRTRVVPGRMMVSPTTIIGMGISTALLPPIILIGEAPGENEDHAGKPFVGRSGKALEELTVGMKSPLYLTNVVKCRPVEGGKNRAPKPREVESCTGWLSEELDDIDPLVIVVLGKVAAQRMGLLDGSANAKHPAGVYKVDMGSGGGRPRIILASYHPAFALRAGGVTSDIGKRIREDLEWSDKTNLRLHKELMHENAGR